jgi:hypothetical protein
MIVAVAPTSPPASVPTRGGEERPVHVVAARDDATKHCYVITAYVPDPALWGGDFKTRKPT